MGSSPLSTPPPYARPSHTLTTPRLILRSAIPDDAPAFTHLFSHPLNNPFGGIVGTTLSEAEQRASLAKQAASTARGDNAWLVVILKPDQSVREDSDWETLKVHDGILIGSTGFNTFKIEKGKGEEEDALVAEIGALIDYRFQRRGYALETLEKVVEYGLGDLGVKKITLETNALNGPFRGLMDQMGIETDEFKEKGKADERDAASYRFWKDEWEIAKEKLGAKGKWYL
jgi:RimJ/RimL family protein N-acetyltransferase